MTRYPKNEVLEAEIAQLEDMSLDKLRTRWLKLRGKPAPKFFRRKFLARAVAYELQMKEYGGLSPATKRQLREVAHSLKAGKEPAAFSRTPIKPGTRLVRQWREKVHTVTVVPDGFEWNGEKHSSLSAVAKAITGTNWNGYAFFGLKGKTKTKDPATEASNVS